MSEFTCRVQNFKTLPHASLTDSQSWNQCTLHISFVSVSPLHARVPVSGFIMYSPLQSVRGAWFLNAIRSSGTVHAPRCTRHGLSLLASLQKPERKRSSKKMTAQRGRRRTKIPHRLSPHRGERSSAVLQRVKRSSGSVQWVLICRNLDREREF